MKMTEQYIKCSNCKCKYHNKDENIEEDFGYSRLGERFKCCVKCREKRRKYNEKYRESDKYKEYYETKGRAYNFAKLTCATCGAIVCRNVKRRHEREKGCVFDPPIMEV
jgi:hypothetical protein